MLDAVLESETVVKLLVEVIVDLQPGNTNRRGRIGTVDLLIKLGCFVTKGKI